MSLPSLVNLSMVSLHSSDSESVWKMLSISVSNSLSAYLLLISLFALFKAKDFVLLLESLLFEMLLLSECRSGVCGELGCFLPGLFLLFFPFFLVDVDGLFRPIFTTIADKESEKRGNTVSCL